MSARSHFSIAGIPIRIEPFFVLVAVLFGMQFETFDYIAAWVVIMFVSILVHELGHGFALKFFGRPSSIVLHGFGGVTVRTDRTPISKVRNIVVSLSGSLTALVVLWLPARFALQTDAAEHAFVDWLSTGSLNWWWILYYVAFANLWWSLANLLPVRPLDGGNVATQLIGLSRARWLSIAVAGTVAIWLLVERPQDDFAPIFLGLLAFMNLMEIRAERRGDRMNTFDVDAPEGSAPTKRGRRARRPHLHALPGMAPPPSSATPPTAPVDSARVEQAAWAALSAGDHQRARALVERLRGATEVSPFLTPAVALASGSQELAVDLYEQAWRARPQGPSQLVATELLGRTGAAVQVAERLVRDPAGRDAAGTLQTHLHYAGCYQAAAEVGQIVAGAGPSTPPQTAFETACSWARAGEVDRAVDWLERAADAGFRAPSLVDGEPDLALVRSDPRWPVLRARLA